MSGADRPGVALPEVEHGPGALRPGAGRAKIALGSRRWAAALAIAALALPPTQAAAEQMSLQEVIAITHAAGFACGESLLLAVAVAVSESSLNPRAIHQQPQYGPREDGTTHYDRGLWQISTFWWPVYSDAVAFDPAGAAAAAFEISAGGTDFTPWDSFDSGKAQRRLDEAFGGWPALRPFVEKYCE